MIENCIMWVFLIEKEAAKVCFLQPLEIYKGYILIISGILHRFLFFCG